MCGIICFGEPVEDDPKQDRPNTFRISMAEGCYQPACLATYLCPVCCVYYARTQVIDSDMSRYTCCQGYLNNRCFQSGQCGEQSCPQLCLMTEAVCCLGPSMSSSRMFLMDQ
jgi:hypothetical protein